MSEGPAAGPAAGLARATTDDINLKLKDRQRGCGHMFPHKFKEGICSKTAHDTRDGTDEKSYAMLRAETKNDELDEEQVMWLNGETKPMMDHVKARWKSCCYDTSVDTPWKIDEDLACRDSFVWYTTIIHLAIKIICLVIPMLLLAMFPMAVVYVYARSQTTPCDTIKRTCGYWVLYWISFILYLPALIILFVSLFWDYMAYYIFGFLFTLFNCRWNECCKSHRALDPYRNGPSLLWHGADIFSCVCGQSLRHGYLGTCWNLVIMWLLMPWMKYYWNTNPWVMDLEERYVQQISTTLADQANLRNEPDEHPDGNPKYVEEGICDTARRIISRAKQWAFVRADEDLWNFAPHYPYPPDDRRWCIGMQAGGSASSACKFTLLVHTTHANSTNNYWKDEMKEKKNKKATEQFVLSNSVHSPVYRVMLWYSNPFHFFTGFVEASISRGGDSQPNKYLGGEHPMWLVSAHSPFVSERESMTGVGMIDQFFDDWLPIFVHQARRLGTLGHILHKQVHPCTGCVPMTTKDGVSQPDNEKAPRVIHDGVSKRVQCDASVTCDKDGNETINPCTRSVALGLKCDARLYTEKEAGVKAARWADNNYQECIGCDGLSAVDPRMGREAYIQIIGGKKVKMDKVSAQEEQADRDGSVGLFSTYVNLHKAIIDDDHKDEEKARKEHRIKTRQAVEAQQSLRESHGYFDGEAKFANPCNSISHKLNAMEYELEPDELAPAGLFQVTPGEPAPAEEAPVQSPNHVAGVAPVEQTPVAPVAPKPVVETPIAESGQEGQL